MSEVLSYPLINLKEVNKIIKLLTIDSSTNKSGLGYYEHGKYIGYDLLDFSKDKKMESRFESMSIRLLDKLDEFNPDIVYIEETVVLRNAQTQRFLTRLQGVVYGWCVKHYCEFNTIRPTEWRKQLSFNQGKNVKREQLKQQSMDYVKEKYNIEVNDDVADALCIGSAVLKMFGIKDGDK